jgi:hypothetical protein
MDTSPMHSPFQTYQGAPLPGDSLSMFIFGAWLIDLQFYHKQGEQTITAEQMSSATQALRDNYRKVYGDNKHRYAVPRRSPLAFLNVGSVYYVPSWSNVLDTVTVRPDGTMSAKGKKLKYHPAKTK